MTFKFSERYTEIIFGSKFKISLPEHASKIFIIDKNVFHFHTDFIKELINDSPAFYLETNEKNKSFKTVYEIYSFFQKNKVNRSTIIVGIGGGVTTDLTAFCASTFMRGCKLWLVPTTFLAMIDAAIGGKTAVNFKGIKNNIGTFYLAEKVIIITDFLDSLLEEEMNNGWAECIKVALIKETDLYDKLIKAKKIISREIIEKAIEIKLSLCKDDIEDRDNRRYLNLGHTFGHIIESISNFEISHGLAISLGIRASASLSLKNNYITDKINHQIQDILDLYSFPNCLDHHYKNSLMKNGKKILQQDKKSTYQNKKIKHNLILFKGFQEVFIESFESQEIIQHLSYLIC
jgi:3-dehydroquinate synthase